MQDTPIHLQGESERFQRSILPLAESRRATSAALSEVRSESAKVKMVRMVRMRKWVGFISVEKRRRARDALMVENRGGGYFGKEMGD